MKTKAIVLTLLLGILFSCDFRKSVHADLLTGLTTEGDGLSCEKVYLTVDDEKINRNTFTYGEIVYLHFEQVEGFKKTGEQAFPGMQLVVTDPAGDTMLQYDDLYADEPDGFSLSPLKLSTFLTVGTPLHSNNKYALFVKIWDKKGAGTFTAKMDVEVVPNKAITIESSGISFEEIYLFSKDRDLAVTGDQVKYNENMYLIFEGLEGIKEEEGKVFIGLGMNIRDADGRLILDEANLAGDDPMDAAEVSAQLAPTFIFTGSNLKNPVTCIITIKDKKSGKSLKATVLLNVTP